jgi:hypothetical protein
MQVNLFVLAHEKIGVSRNYVYASSLRQQLEPALEELKEKGLLSEYEFVGKGKSTDVVLVAAHAPRKTLATPNSNSPMNPEQSSSQVTDTPAFTGTGGDEARDHLEQLLIQRGIQDKQAKRLVNGRTVEILDRIKMVISHFDKLVEGGSHLVSRNPAGFLYRAVEKPFDFILPTDKGTFANGQRPQQELSLEKRAPTSSESPPKRKSTKNSQIDIEVSYLLERKKVLDAIRQETSPEAVAVIQADVENALAKLKAHISPRRFQEAVEHGVEQRILEQSGFPDFDRWCKEHS